MSANQYRRQLESKRKQRVDAEKKAGEYRSKEATKRAAAAKARLAATKSTSRSTISSKLREAERCEKEAATAGTEANRWQAKASAYAKTEADLQVKLAKAEKSEADAAERRRKREQQQADLRQAAEVASLQQRMNQTESIVHNAMRQLPAPKTEKLRILLLGASSESGDAALRVHGHYSFALPDLGGGRRPLRDPNAIDEHGL